MTWSVSCGHTPADAWHTMEGVTEMMRFLSVFLQAAGVWFLLWGLFGWLLMRGEQGGLCVRYCEPGSVSRAQRFAETCLWFRETGLIRMRVLLINGGLSQEEESILRRFSDAREHVCLCSRSEAVEILERESKNHGRT